MPPTYLPVQRGATVIRATDAQYTTTTLANDSVLFVPVQANAKYLISGCLLLTADPAADIQMTLTAPAGSVGGWTPAGVTLSTTDGTGSIRLSTFAFGAASSLGVVAAGNVVSPRGGLVTGAAGGTLQLQAAQAASSGTPTVIQAGSWLTVERIG